jgi:hypothetical protein
VVPKEVSAEEAAPAAPPGDAGGAPPAH